jgi:hypothetical protein
MGGAYQDEEPKRGVGVDADGGHQVEPAIDLVLVRTHPTHVCLLVSVLFIFFFFTISLMISRI